MFNRFVNAIDHIRETNSLVAATVFRVGFYDPCGYIKKDLDKEVLKAEDELEDSFKEILRYLKTRSE